MHLSLRGTLGKGLGDFGESGCVVYVGEKREREEYILGTGDESRGGRGRASCFPHFSPSHLGIFIELSCRHQLCPTGSKRKKTCYLPMPGWPVITTEGALKKDPVFHRLK